ncbi:class D beta-lactamase [Pseudochrobactrum algeriensis]|uniref:class D beta-lactamase n=1 Tax=Pseudochrobactrum algeriensis TaxID=2834768 RepID=UPI001BCB313A|nr:class D beta-lactamase [Pseudochrobactrum algeriensis]MBX8811571.1 class D beta-lactamase [Ochrobactrum sp. MR34]QVQ35973.1 class D beta-lactamase [Pseudochrobactrum algeriensis]QVQ39191.1 class D beta-lactamase [Pseudochrobactrum algeriensis]QVQ43111.1 class D beta-lactamase [Pseudochrobactrum algeriensis]
MDKKLRSAALLAFALTSGTSFQAQAGEKGIVTECAVVMDAATQKILSRKGVCDKRFTPASTFKVPLAVIGYDKNILRSEHDPVWQWKPEMEAPERDRIAVDPARWLEQSVVWYSREITKQLGQKQFSEAVAALDYGNKDVSGRAGKKDGLTGSWIGSSLEISPDEQVQFLNKLVHETLPVSKQAQQKTKAAMTVFTSEKGWKVTGKTGAARLRDANGKFAGEQRLGWFVGWAEKDGRQLVFANMQVFDKALKTSPGLLIRGQFLQSFDQ